MGLWVCPEGRCAPASGVKRGFRCPAPQRRPSRCERPLRAVERAPGPPTGGSLVFCHPEGGTPVPYLHFARKCARLRFVENETMTLWVRLRGDERRQAEFMRDREKRSYASLIRVALAHYYDTNYADEFIAETA